MLLRHLILTALPLSLLASTLPADDLASLSDDFARPETLSQWQRLHRTEGWGAEQLETYNLTTRPGHLLMIPHTSVWYRDYVGAFAYKLVRGDFIATTAVHITNRANRNGAGDGDGVPQSPFSLGGLMLRTPRPMTTPAQWRPGTENYVFLSLGYGNDPAGPRMQFEVKSTTNSDSQLSLSPAAGHRATLRWARLGQVLIALRQEEAGQWIVHQRYRRPDMPAELQVGMVTYTDWTKAGSYPPEFQNSHVLKPGLRPDPSNRPDVRFTPDLVAAFDYVRFAQPTLPAHLAGRDLADPRQVSDQDLLTFLARGPQ